jgi:hypothetical protein
MNDDDAERFASFIDRKFHQMNEGEHSGFVGDLHSLVVGSRIWSVGMVLSALRWRLDLDDDEHDFVGDQLRNARSRVFDVLSEWVGEHMVDEHMSHPSFSIAEIHSASLATDSELTNNANRNNRNNRASTGTETTESITLSTLNDENED